MVIIDIINNNSYDDNLINSLVNRLSQYRVPYTFANVLCADEEFNNEILIRKGSNDINSDRILNNRNYYINNELIKNGTISYSFLNEYIEDDDYINASNDILSIILGFNNKDLLNRPDLEIGDFQYIVQNDDNLYDLASRYNTTADNIIKKNNLTSNELKPGQTLIIGGPSVTGETLQYIVRAGDRLKDIADKYSTNIDDLRKYNNLTEDNLKIGQVLIINPVAESVRPVRYIVKSGDSLYSIARRYNVSVNDIKSMNKLESNFLKVGQQLLLPD